MNVLIHPSPVGPLTLVSEADKLIGCYFSNNDFARQKLGELAPVAGSRDAVLRLAQRELDQFFAGRLNRFKVAVAPRGTEFQRAVWRALQSIPFGKTLSYGDIARQIRKPAAMRAVGAANGQNPICIIIPCHRVIGANGSLTGFGGGLERKQYLLALERGEAQLTLGADQSCVRTPASNP